MRVPPELRRRLGPLDDIIHKDMDREKYIEMIVDSYDGNLDAEGERSLREAMDADPLREMLPFIRGIAFRRRFLQRWSIRNIYVRKSSTGSLSVARAPLRIIVATVSAAAVIAARRIDADTIAAAPHHADSGR